MLQAISQKLKQHFQREPKRLLSTPLVETPKTTPNLAAFSLLGHELRTPLNAIVGFAELLQQAERDNATQRQRLTYTAHILDSAQHLQNLLAQILDASRAHSGELSCSMQNFDLADVLEMAARKLQDQANANDVTLNVHLVEGVSVYGDVHRFSQACSALIDNAIRFSNASGEVTVSIQQSSDSGLIISICDTGRGISSDEVDRLLNPFTQSSGGFARSHNGMGLGLYLANAIAKLHGGSVALLARAGAGTEARIILPSQHVTWSNQPAKDHITA